jgi:hypothetical protein
MKEAEKRGIKVTVAYVHADPQTAWNHEERGAIQRAKEKGKMPDVNQFVDSHVEGAKNFQQFKESDLGKKANFLIIDNTKKDPEVVEEIPPTAFENPQVMKATFLNQLNASDVTQLIKDAGQLGENIKAA